MINKDKLSKIPKGKYKWLYKGTLKTIKCGCIYNLSFIIPACIEQCEYHWQITLQRSIKNRLV